jgi:hypothetical protein
MATAFVITGRMQRPVKEKATAAVKEKETVLAVQKETVLVAQKETAVAVDKVINIATVGRIRRRPLQPVNHQETRKTNFRLIPEAGKYLTTGYPASILFT